MKPKILLAKYFDRVILGCLMLLLIYAVYKASVRDTTVADLASEIDRCKRIIEKEMAKEDPPVITTRDYLDELRSRLERSPVLSKYIYNPFFPAADTSVTERPLQIMVGQSKAYVVGRRNLVEVIETDENVVLVEFQYVPQKHGSKVTITGIGTGGTHVRIRDDRGHVFVWRVVVLEEPAPPNPPRDVAFAAKPSYERDGKELRPPRVLITFRRNDPPMPTKKAGFTSGATLYRKFADEPDVDYKLLTREESLKTLTAKSIQEIKMVWDDPAGERIEEGPPPEEGSIVPKRVEIIPTPSKVEPREEEPRERLIPGQFGFLDTNVEQGERYVYKIVTVSAVEERPPVVCKDPYVIGGTVPSLTSFFLRSAGVTTTSIMVTRANPAGEKPFTNVFRVIAGMSIGGIVRVDKRRGQSVDFATDCIMVDTLQEKRSVQYRVRRNARTGKFTYKVRLKARTSSDWDILYLSPSRFLRRRGRLYQEVERIPTYRETEPRREGGGPLREPYYR